MDIRRIGNIPGEVNQPQQKQRVISDSAASAGDRIQISDSARAAQEASALANMTGASIFHRLLWREEEVLNLGVGRWRRAVQFVPRDGLRGALPSVLVMGRRPDKLRALTRRLLRGHRSKPL